MVDKIPSRLLDDDSGIADFEIGETVPLAHGGTGAPDSATARSNLGAASDTDLSNHTSDNSNPHGVTAGQVGSPTTSQFNVLDNTVSNHVSDNTNPHSVSAGQIGAIPTSEKAVANGVATLDGGGKIPVLQIPSISLPEVYVVADATARLALIVQEGDEAIQLDDGSHWIFNGSAWFERPGSSIGYGQTTTTTSVNVNTSSPTIIDFDTPITFAGSVSMLTTQRMQVSVAGVFRASYSMTADSDDDSRKNIRCRLVVNTNTNIVYSESFGYSRNNTDEELTCSNSVLLVLAAGDFVELESERKGSGGDSLLNSAQLNMERVS